MRFIGQKSTIFAQKLNRIMKFLHRIIFIIALFVLPSMIFAQSPGNPIRWRVNVRMTSPSEGEVILKAISEPGWHLYGTDIPKGGPKPTAIDLSKSKGVQFTSPIKVAPSPVKVHDDMFGIDLTWWEGNVTFRRSFKVTNPNDARIEGTITYMGCNNKTCMPPATENISKPLPIKK